MLAETGAPLPPILVHRATMRIIDGRHRIIAARLKGHDTIEVQFFDGDEDKAFVAAVSANVTHGLPLSLADREAAAARIIKSYSQWSDRAIAEAAGLAANTVAKIRHRLTDETPQLNARVGRDGRLRPLNSAAGRRIASQIIADRPHASLREIAKESGISLATAKDVRERVRRGDDPVPLKAARAEEKNAETPGRRDSESPGKRRPSRIRRSEDKNLILEKLQRDPSLRMSENGRLLLRWLSSHSISAKDWERQRADLPAHCASLVADLALEYAKEWETFAASLNMKT